jgi:hypothetical protein
MPLAVATSPSIVYGCRMSHSFEPLVAYLEAIRGPVRVRSGALDAGRVAAVGFPEPWPGDDESLSDSARAELVIKHLRTAIDAIRDIDRLHGAILFQYFFGEGLESNRQGAAVDAAGAKQSAARNFRRKALLELADRLCSQAEQSDTRSKRGRVAAPTPRDVAECIVRDLESLYEPGGLDRLARMIVSDAPVYDASVTLTLRDSVDDDAASYFLTESTIGAWRRSAYYLAVSARATLTDLIKSKCDQVAAAFTCSHQNHVMERAEAWTTDESVFTLLSADADELAKQDPLPLRLADEAEREEVLANIPPDRRRDVALLRADIPRDETDPPSRVGLRLTSLMARSDHYCFWIAARPTFLQTMTFDASGMTLGVGERFTLQPCFRGPAYEPEPHDDVYEIRVEGWIVRGQGAVLVWG